MDERENLPAKLAAQGLAATAEMRGSLVARGMAVLKMDNDALYRQARAVFDRRNGTRNWNSADDPAIFSAFKILQRLADEKYGKAYYPLSILYSGRNDIEDGDSRARHYTHLALEWCLANQNNDDAELWCDLADMHNTNGFKDYGVTQSNEIAEVWYRKAADKGYARAQWELGSLFCFCAEGHSGHSDRSAYYWMELAAHQGNAFYQICLAEYYEILRWGELSESQQYQKAVYWYRMAAEQGDGCGQYCLGKMYEKGLGIDQDDEQFVYWVRKAAEQDYRRSQWEFGEMFANGHGVAQDNEQAEYWFRKAAEQDNVGDDQNNLGEMYIHGCGVAEAYNQAAFWFRKAAEQGHADAQFNLGKMYQEGFGVEQDDVQAAHWFHEAAEQDQTYAQYNLGRMYEEGCGVEQNSEQAEHWLREVYREIYGDDGEDGAWCLDEQDYEKYSEWTCNYDHWAQHFPLPPRFPEKLLTTAPQDVVVFLSHTGYINAQPLAEHLAHPRDSQVEGVINKIFIASTHDYIVCFSNRGRVYWLRVNDVPEGSSISFGNLLPLEESEKIKAVLPVSEFREDKYVFSATSSGMVKKTPLPDFSRPMKRGIIAFNLDEGDSLIGAILTDGKHDVMLFSDGGKSVRFDENDVRPTGRASRGVRGMKLAEGQKVISLLVPDNEQQSVLTATENGFGKRSPIVEYTRHGRGTQGMIAIMTSARNGKAVAAMLVDEDDEAMLITSANRMFRARVNKIREMSRCTQGITLVGLSEGEKLSSLEKLVKPIVEK